MTQLEFTEVVSLLKSLWGSWKPSDDLIAVFYEEFSRYEIPDLLKAVRRYRVHTRFNEPRIPDLLEELKRVIGERKSNEKKGPGWPGQVFVVVHRNAEREEDGIWHFHTANESQEVPYEFQSRRMEGHVHYCQTRFSDRYPAGGHFSGEIHTEESFSKRFREISLGMAGPEVKARRAEVEERLFNGEDPKQVFRSMFKVVEEKAKVPFKRMARFEPPLPTILPPTSNGSVITEQGLDDVPPSERDWTASMVFDENENIVDNQVPATPEPAPKPRKENPKADWLDADLKF